MKSRKPWPLSTSGPPRFAWALPNSPNRIATSFILSDRHSGLSPGSMPCIDANLRGADKRPPMTDTSAWILSEAYAGLQAQAIGLTEAAGLRYELRPLAPAIPWRWIAAKLWPAPLSVVADAVR